MDGGVRLTAQDIARELMVDARRVRLIDLDYGRKTAVEVSRDSDQRWRRWDLPYAGDLLTALEQWVKS